MGNKVGWLMKSSMKHILFRAFEKYFRVHILPVHFYSPVPCVAEIKDELFSEVSDCVGLDMQDRKQLEALDIYWEHFYTEFSPQPNTGLSMVDAFTLYAIIRNSKPGKMVEIGSGESTAIALHALCKNREQGYGFKFVAIEPYPSPHLLKLSDPDFLLIRSKVQDVPIADVVDADILFIDSSHVSKIGSDVNHEILKLIPNLKVGALVHWHDIMIPAEYPKRWIEKGTFWNESYMVHAFMLHNKCFEIVWAARYMQLKYPNELSSRMQYFQPENENQQLSSFWIRRIL